jgi:hypothetical protein
MNNENKKILKVTHSSGFFSNMTIRLYDLYAFMKEHKCYPDEIDSSEQFSFYKHEAFSNLIPYYIKDVKDEIHFIMPNCLEQDFMAIQWNDYRLIDYDNINPIIYKYFSLGYLIEENKAYLKSKYKLDKYIGVFFRGNDKRLETNIAKYDTFINKIKEVRALYPDLPILLIPDECLFKQFVLKEFDNVICFDELPCIDNPTSCKTFELPLKDRPQYGAIYNAAVSLMSESEHLITHSGNGGLWACFYRGNADNVHQCFNNKFYE